MKVLQFGIYGIFPQDLKHKRVWDNIPFTVNCSITHGEIGLGRLLPTTTGLTQGLYMQVSGLKARYWTHVKTT